MYFQNFPVIYYKGKDVTNLLRRVGVRTNDVKEGETPEMIADKLYGDSTLHWVVLMVNNIVDRYHEWPMAGNQFLDYVNEKYSNPSATHHYEIAQSSGDTSVKTDRQSRLDAKINKIIASAPTLYDSVTSQTYDGSTYATRRLERIYNIDDT